MIIQPTSTAMPATARQDKNIADGLEKAFLAEMLKYAGPKPMDGSFGGGIGEEQFASMLTETYADALSKRLDLGLAAKLELRT